MTRPRNREQRFSGSENLSKRDRELNLLSDKLGIVTSSLHGDSHMVIKSADREYPSEHAEVKTDVLARMKTQLAQLNLLIKEVEKSAKIIDIKPDPKSLE